MGESSPAARYGAEFVGTFMLVFTIGCNVLSGQPVWGGISIACVLTVMIYALGKSSGANFNPAVSVGLGLADKLPWGEVLKYSVVQIIAGLLAGACYSGLFRDSFTLEPAPGHNMRQAVVAEMLYTFMLVFVVLNVAASKFHAGKNQFYGLAIGFVIVAGAYSGGSVSGGCFNPAVAIAIDVSSMGFHSGWCLYYVFYELIGAALAVMLFKVVRPGDFVGEPHRDPSLQSKLVSEFLGTYMLVLTVGLNVLAASPAGAFSIAASLMCMIYALGDISGANFNPAVTVAVILSSSDMTPKLAGLYMLVQAAGGLLAGLTYQAIHHGKSFALGPHKGHSWNDVISAEFVFTFVLCYVVIATAVSSKTKSRDFFGFTIGSCVTVGGCAIGSVSGGSLNPAVSFGVCATNGLAHFGKFLGFTLIEMAGALAAAGVASATHGSKVKASGADVL